MCSNIWTEFNNVSLIGLFAYNFNDMTQNNGKNNSKAETQHFFPINITTTWNALPYDVVNSRIVNIQEPPRCTLGRQSPRCAGQLVTEIDVPSLEWTVVVPAWFRVNDHTNRYLTTHNTANPLYHTVIQVQYRPGKGDDWAGKGDKG